MEYTKTICTCNEHLSIVNFDFFFYSSTSVIFDSVSLFGSFYGYSLSELIHPSFRMGTPFIIKLASASFSHSFLVDPTCLLLLSSQLPPQEIKTLYIILFFYFYFISIYFISTINLIFMILFCSLILQKFHHIFKRLHFEAGMKTQNPNWKLEHKNWCRTWVYGERPGSSYLDPKTWSMTSVGGYFDFGDRSGWVLQFRRLKLVRWMWIKRMKVEDEDQIPFFPLYFIEEQDWRRRCFCKDEDDDINWRVWGEIFQ